MENSALLNLLESILGQGNVTSKGNVSFHCPLCITPHKKKKLEINIDESSPNYQKYACWICGEKGKKLITLFKKLKVQNNKISELNFIVGSNSTISDLKTELNESISLPTEFIPLFNHLDSNQSKLDKLSIRRALHYLKKRNIFEEDCIKYNIGVCLEGNYKDRIIIPSYDENGIINYFIARSYIDSDMKYKNPPTKNRNIIGWELYINWNAPIILVEGIFDALCIKRNVIPLFGKELNEGLMQKIVKSEVKNIYIALDKDAQKDALKHCEYLMSYGKNIYLVEMDGKDASEIGFNRFLTIIEKTDQLTFSDLLFKKLNI
jgi:hypothetical protein